MTTLHYQRIAQCGYFALLILVPTWHLYLSPPALGVNPWLITTILILPLIFPLKGILKGDPYTYAWSGFVSLIYVVHACVILMSSNNERYLSSLELLFASLFLIGSIYFAKYKGQELGLSIRIK